MEFREFYRGICAKIRFDYHTGTYIGELDGLPDVSFVEAGSYEDIQKSLKQAVDDHLSGRALNRAREWAMAAHAEEEKAAREAEERQKTDDEVDASYNRRKFLR